jgi:transcription elongation factor GreA
MKNTNTQITKKGLEVLKTELQILVEKKRPNLVIRLSEARAAGDLAENSDYHNAKEELEFLDGRIAELDDVIENSTIINGDDVRGTVSVGNAVKVKVNGITQEFHIVGEWEADPVAKKISHTSPLGQALVGKKKGAKVEVEAPAGKIVYEIIEVI